MGNVVNRVFDSSGPEGKVRGTPQQIIEKYLVLARDAQLSNDRVAHENFLQHAEHYIRLLSEAQREMNQGQGDAGRGNNGGNGDEANQSAGHGSGGANGGQNGARDRRDGEHGQSSRGDALEVAGDGAEDTGLVATPEETGKFTPRGGDGSTGAGETGTPPAKPRRARGPRRPRNQPEPGAARSDADGAPNAGDAAGRDGSDGGSAAGAADTSVETDPGGASARASAAK